jgi:hypothetical protein
MNLTQFTKSFDACVSHGSRTNHKGASIEVFGPTGLRGRDMGGYKAHIKLASGEWKEDGIVYPSEQAAIAAAKRIVDTNA